VTAADRGEVATLRPAVVEDAEPLARCHLTCWQQTYTGLVDADRLAAALAEVGERIERWRRILTESPGTLLAEDAGAVVGFAAAGPQRDDDLDVALELYALYVLRSHQGRRIGHRLLEAVTEDADCSLWVLGSNAHARTFYARHGFVADGSRKVDDLFGVEVRMVRRAG
jgi:GNAT superfamily N-acetyltransferase